MKATSSRREVAQRLNIHPMTIYRWERDQKVPPPRRLKRTQECFYTEEDINRLIAYRDATE